MKQKNKIKNSHQVLEYLGLNENEALLYHILLQRGEATVQDLQKHSPFPRTLIYHILNQLIPLGLVTFIRKTRRTIYMAEDPEKLYDLLTQQEKEFEKKKNKLKEVIPELKYQYRLSQNRPILKMFEGIEMYRDSFEDVMNTKPTVIFTYKHISEKKVAGLEIREQMNQKRIAWGIPEKVLLLDTPAAHRWITTQPKDLNTEFRLISKKMSPWEIDFRIYQNKIVSTNYTGKEPVVLLIEDHQLADLQKNIFLLLWENAKPKNT